MSNMSTCGKHLCILRHRPTEKGPALGISLQLYETCVCASADPRLYISSLSSMETATQCAIKLEGNLRRPDEHFHLSHDFILPSRVAHFAACCGLFISEFSLRLCSPAFPIVHTGSVSAYLLHPIILIRLCDPGIHETCARTALQNAVQPTHANSLLSDISIWPIIIPKS